MNKFLLAIIGISFNLNAAETSKTSFGRIVDLKGSGFISFKGKTREITKGDSIEMGSQIVIEHHGQVTFTDNADHRFHLGNSSSVSVDSKNVELRSGDLWFQSLNKNDDYKITTANAMVNYQGGEAILSYDSVKGKSQLMVINGMMKLSNLRAPDLNLSVAEGHFSFIDNAYDEGAPRDPTSVGAKTYGELIGLFNGIAPMDKNSAIVFKDHEKGENTHHEHAVAENKHHEHAKAAHDSSRSIASVTSEKPENLLEEYKSNLLGKSKKKVTNKLSSTKVGTKKVASGKLDIHIYGLRSAPSLAATSEEMPSITANKKLSSRGPASVLDQDVPNGTSGTNGTKEEGNTDSSVSPYSKYFTNQKKDSDNLINDLKKL